MLDRRSFLKQTLITSAALALPFGWTPALADPRVRSLRVTGQVRADGRGLAGVAVTDGVTVTTTRADGTFALVSTNRRPFVYLSVPAGYAIPQHATGTARFYQPLPSDRDEATVRFDLTRLPQADDRHAFLALGDTQMQDAYEVGRFHAETVPDVQATLRTLGDVPVFGVAVGDILFDDLTLYPDYERAVQQMGVPFFQVVGNHDLDFSSRTDEGATATFERHFGPRYYSFNRGAVHYVVLDDVFWTGRTYIGYLDDVQLAWLAQDLALIEAGRPVVVFMHIPARGTGWAREGRDAPTPSNAVLNYEALYDLLAPYQAHVLVGHTHEMEHLQTGRVHEYVLGAACGAWWSGDICYDGAPNGYAVFDVNGEALSWRYKSTGQPADHQVRVYARGADPTAPDEVVANVWDWDPAWTVVWYEGSDRRGAMARRRGTDPLSERLHRGPDLPARRTWVDPEPTDHLFYAPLAPDARNVRVETTDRFGRVYTATMG